MLVYASSCLSLPCLFSCLLLVAVAVVMLVLVLVVIVALPFVVVLISSGQESGLQVLDILRNFYISHC